MKKFRKILMMFIALNSLALATSTTNDISQKSLGHVHKNITEKKNVDDSYKLIEKILKKRNEELKDLRLQSDFAVKKESQEWQVFFSGLYVNNNRGGHKNNAPFVINQEDSVKSINLGKAITVREVNNVSLNPEVNVENKIIAEAPHIVVPSINLPNLSISDPNAVASPQIISPDISVNTNITVPTVALTPITVVSFGLPYFNSYNSSLSYRFNVQPTLGYSQTLSAGRTQESIITLYGAETPKNYLSNNGGTLIISKSNTRAMEVDEAVNRSLHINNSGVIILNESMTTGMEARGPQIINTSNIENHQTYISNDGTITGNGGYKNQAGLSVGVDGSVTGSLIHMVNRETGTITMNSPESIGIQLRPDQNLLVMHGENQGIINVNGYRSYGMMTTPGPGSGFLNQDHSLPNGSSYLVLYPQGTINVNGDEGTGFAILVGINSWGGGGIINVGVANPNQDSNGNLYSSSSLVERATGLYSKQPIINVPCASSPTGLCGGSGINGTGEINVGSFAYQSSAVRVEEDGQVGNAGTINITGDNNYGAVVKGGFFSNHIWTPGGDIGRMYINANNAVGIYVNGDNLTLGENKSLLTVNGNNSIGFLMNNGRGQNLGINNDPLDYWRSDGIIETTGINSHAVVLTKENSEIDTIFHNRGLLKNNTEGTVGIYAEKGANFHHGIEIPAGFTGKIQSGDGAIGIYAKDSGTYGTIKAPIITGNSTSTNTAIAVMSDGSPIIEFYNNGTTSMEQASLNIGKNAVGIYSINGSKFSDTFKIYGLRANLGQNSVFAYLKEATVNISNLSNIILDSMGTNSAMLYGANNSDIYVDSNVNIALNTNAQSYVAENSKITLNSGKILTSGLNTGLSAFSLDGKTFSNGNSVILNNFKTGVLNKGTVTMNSANAVGLYSLFGQNLNDSTGIINIVGNNGVGMYSEEQAELENKGTINLNSNNAVGIFGKGDSGKNYSSSDNINIINAGIINANGSGSIGIGANNNKAGSTLADSIINNNGNINVNGANAVGIYAPKTTVTNTGDIILTGNNTVGVYGTNGTEITGTGTIDLDINNQNQIAYYLTDSSKVNALGNIIGHGIAVYVKDIMLDDSFATIDLTSTSDQGAGKIGLVLGGTSVFNYTKDIKVGDSAGSNYSVALYTDNQNLSAGIANNLAAGANGVGLYAQNGSNIKYSGIINVGDGTTAGTGVFVGSNGTSGSIITLDNAAINLNGAGGIGAYIDNLSTFNFNNTSTINFYGDGVALFGNAGSTINDNGGIINTNGFNVERTRIANGTINITADTTIADNNILGHVVNGEMNVFSGITVAATGNKIIGIYASGLKGASSWLHTYEANNFGILDFSNAENSTALYLDNARGENFGLTKVGSSSLGMYGVNNAELYNNSIIEAGNKAVGMYGKNSKIENNNNISTLGDKAVGMYGVNSNLENKGNINLNNITTVGMYGDSSNVVNTNTLNVNGEKSVGIYGENFSNIQNNQNILLGSSSAIERANTGIYNNSSAVNNGNIIGGNYSIGIYNTGNFDNFGNIQLGTGAVGVYSDGGNSIIHAGSTVSAGEAALLVKNGVLINDSTDIMGNFLGYAGVNGKLVNNANLNVKNTGFYSNMGELENNGIITSENNDAIFFYGDNAKIVNNNSINAAGTGSIGIYGKDSILDNAGKITVGDSEINSKTNSKVNKYSMGIYGRNSTITNIGDIEIGENAIGIYGGSNSNITNDGNITANKNNSVGIFLDKSSAINNGIITMNGDNSTGIYLQENSNLVNTGTININGKDSTGIYLYDNHSTLINTGTINLTGDNSIGIITPENMSYTAGTIVATGSGNSITGNSSIKYYEKPQIINAGQINIDGNFDTSGLDIIIKIDPSKISEITAEGNTVSLIANAINVRGNLTGNGTVKIAPDFTKDTNFETYVLKDMINTSSFSGLDSGEIKLESKSITWESTPVKNIDGTTDIYMSKISYDKLSKDLWFNNFAKNLDSQYFGATGKSLNLFDKIDGIENETNFRHVFGSLAGNIYANMNQREQDIARVFENSLDLLQDSKNNTKENIKINIITGKSSTDENTNGVVGYDSTTVGVLALREVERTYKHKFGYSIGYSHTNFEFNDGNDSEELADTIQLGVHNKYRLNSDYILKNDLTGRVSFYNIDRNIDWENSKSEINGHYETYSVTLDNNIGREIELNKNNTLIPYAGLKLAYLVRPGFTEKGLEALQIQGNNSWNVKPEVGVEFKTSTNEFKNGWKLKGTLDLSYGYELVDNNSERARLTAIEDDHHNLATSRDENGTLKTKAIIGAEIEDKYGIFLTGEYLTGNSNKNDYKAGLTLKAVF